MDADYGYENQLSLKTYDWKPEFPFNLITVIKLTPKNFSLTMFNQEILKNKQLIKQHLINTKFFAGDSNSIKKYHDAYKKKIIDLAFNKHLFEDSQVIFNLYVGYLLTIFFYFIL